jgi:methionine-rich copper-binding protein CopC
MLKRSFVGAIALTLLATPVASAHSKLISSDPKSGAVVTVLPKQVVLTFNEKLMVINKINPSKMVITESSGIQIDKKDSKVVGSQLITSLKSSAKSGTIRVRYHVVSEDGHHVDGTFTFKLR